MKYVGQTIQPLRERIWQHKHHGELYVDQEIQRLGWENFTVEVLETCPFKLLNAREIFWIASLNTKYPNGYNLTSGGSGFNGRKHTPESIALMSDIAKAIWARRSPEERAAIARKREANRSPEERSAISKKAWVTRQANEAKKKSQLIGRLIGLLKNFLEEIA